MSLDTKNKDLGDKYLKSLRETAKNSLSELQEFVSQQKAELRARETGIVHELERGIARVTGLPNVRSNELLHFSGDRRGFAFNLDRDEVGCVLLDESQHVQAGTRVERTGRVLDTPVGDELIGASLTRSADPWTAVAH